MKQADYFGLVSGRGANKFRATRLTPVKSGLVEAPYIEEFPLILECRLLHTFELGLHTQFVGEILDVKADEAVLGSRGLADIKKVRPFLFAPDTQEYYGVGTFLGQAFSVGASI
jgi:flavin reductase (DIM6/NTAB) family NADH-FMN oxidoreductase RutF